MAKLPIFEELVASEAAIRSDYIFRHQNVKFNGDNSVISYDVANPDAGRTRNEVTQRLFETFIRIYDYQFQDSSQHHKIIADRVCNTRDLKEADKKHLLEIFQQFVVQNYDEAGTLNIKDEPASRQLQQLYSRITKEVPLHLVSMALGSLFVELGRGDKWKDTTPRGIDFTRGEPTNNLEQRFQDAFSGKDHPPTQDRYIPPPSGDIETIEGMQFPVKKVEGYRKHVVTNTGHLVDLTTDGPDALKPKLAAHLRSKKPLETFPVTLTDETFHLWQFQQPASETGPSAREVRKVVRGKLEAMGEAHIIDGQKVRDPQGHHTNISLVSLDVDLLSGLTIRAPAGDTSELKRLKSFMAKHGVAEFTDLLPQNFVKNIHIMDEPSKHQACTTLRQHIAATMQKLWQEAAGDTSMQELISRAQQKLEVTLPWVYEISDKAFIADTGEVKLPAKEKKPHLYLTQGGTGSGKGSLKAIAKEECGNTLVVASLDDVRGESDRYWLYPALNNHHEDYKAVEEFAKTVRDLTSRRAMRGGYNLLIDGSGIPYEGRNDQICKEFKDHGYHVSVLGAQAAFFVNDKARRNALGNEGKLPDDATRRIGHRLETELRAVPMEIAAEKHIGFALASRNAARDPNVDRFMIQNVNGHPQDAYTLSYIQTITQDQFEKINNLAGQKLKEELLKRKLVPTWVKLPNRHDRHHEYDLKVVRDNGDGSYRVEIITDMNEYVNMVQKGLLRRDSKGPEALYDNRVHCDVTGHFQFNNGKLKVRSPKGIVEGIAPAFDPMSDAQMPLHAKNGSVR